jgi:transcriptional regulator with XRE-family HTH domain
MLAKWNLGTLPTFGQRVERGLELLGKETCYLVVQVARIASWHTASYFDNVVLNQQEVEWSMVVRLAKLYNITLDELVGGLNPDSYLLPGEIIYCPERFWVKTQEENVSIHLQDQKLLSIDTLSGRLYYLYEQSGVAQRKIAERTRLTVWEVSNLLCGKGRVKRESLEKLCYFFNTDSEQILVGISEVNWSTRSTTDSVVTTLNDSAPDPLPVDLTVDQALEEIHERKDSSMSDEWAVGHSATEVVVEHTVHPNDAARQALAEAIVAIDSLLALEAPGSISLKQELRCDTHTIIITVVTN